jgi:hypothetical protein
MKKRCLLSLPRCASFYQQRDGISLEQIAELYETLPVEDRAKQSARTAVKALNQYLDSLTEFTVANEKLTNRRLFEVVMYGVLAHANEDKSNI